MTKKKKTTAKKTASKTKRYASQVEGEERREQSDIHGKTLVRHDADSAAAMKKIMKRIDCSGPEALRRAVIELAAKGNR